MAIGLLLHRLATAHINPGEIAEKIKAYGTREGEELSFTMPGPKREWLSRRTGKRLLMVVYQLVNRPCAL